MLIERLTIHCLSIPFVLAFQHATKDRRSSDAIIVELHGGGVSGYGEALPREYVTGETESLLVSQLTDHVWPRLRGAVVDAAAPDVLEAIGALLDEALGAPEPAPARAPGVVAFHSLRCALELALVDAWLRLNRRGLAELLPPSTPAVAYSGVISSGSVERAAGLARKMLLGGLQQIKIKVGDEQDEQRVEAVRAVVGSGCSLRVDANGAWGEQQALRKLERLAALGVVSCEEPLGRAQQAALPRLVAASPIPIMVDESLVTAADARWLLEQRGCHAFNLRLNKLGGLLPCLRLARAASEHGVWCQLGSHVGETSVLAAAGRHLALHLGGLRFVEGSFGSLLLSQDIASPSIKFGHGGRGGGIGGPGLGASVVPARLAACTVRRWGLE